MESDRGGASDTPPLELLTGIARDARSRLADPSPRQMDEGWAVVSSRITTQRSRHTRWVRSSLAGALAAALLAVVGAPSLLRLRGNDAAPPALGYEIEGGELVHGGYLRESGTDSIKLHFAEGTEFVLMPGTRGRLRSVTAVGARIAIERGTASFQVTPRESARWEVDVGPFLVAVKGTAFTVSWDPATERFDLRLAHGLVSVAGPVSTGAISVRTGQRLTVDLPKRETVITEEPAEAPTHNSAVGPEPSAAGPAASREEPARAVPGVERRSSDAKAGTKRAWAEAVAAGDWERILDDVDHAGVRRTLAHASSEELLALADAARYRRRTGLARSALLAERARFPGSPPAVDAAFLLGRLAEQTQASASEAVRWYDSYLDAAPNGTYASEALGRKMMVTKQLKGAGDAELLARDYLRRFPDGPYAGAARALSPR